MKSTIYVVATPIGNLADITLRAIEILKNVDFILAEDTRHSRLLLSHFGIQKPLLALHDHNEQKATDTILKRVLTGESCALISDAGTPLISDPGYHFVRSAQDLHIPVVPIPGVCAFVAALSAAGLPSDRFCFEGFLPPKASARRNALEKLRLETRTLIFYEAPHRIQETLEDMAACFGEKREAVIARELTKKFETIKRDSLSALLSWVKTDPNQTRGEIVLLVAGLIKAEKENLEEAQRILKILLAELPLKHAVKLCVEITGVSKRTLYQDALGIINM